MSPDWSVRPDGAADESVLLAEIERLKAEREKDREALELERAARRADADHLVDLLREARTYIFNHPGMMYADDGLDLIRRIEEVT